METAIAMGFEVNETWDALFNLPREVLEEVGWPSPFARVARAIARDRRSAEFAAGQSELWRRVVQRVPDGQNALIVTHGSFVELGAVASLQDAHHGAWGEAIGYCEGVRLSFDGEFVGCEVLRVPAGYHLVEN